MNSPTISGSARFRPTPPERGSFPLDRLGECKELVQAYMACMKKHRSNAEACRDVSKAYLACRMDRNLMARDEWENLGFQKGQGGKQEQEGQEGKLEQESQGTKLEQNGQDHTKDGNRRNESLIKGEQL